MSLPKQIGVE